MTVPQSLTTTSFSTCTRPGVGVHLDLGEVGDEGHARALGQRRPAELHA